MTGAAPQAPPLLWALDDPEEGRLWPRFRSLADARLWAGMLAPQAIPVYLGDDSPRLGGSASGRVVRCPACGHRGALEIRRVDGRAFSLGLVPRIIACRYCPEEGTIDFVPLPDFPRPRGASPGA